MSARLRQWRALLSVEAVLLLLVLIVAGAALYQAQQTAESRRDRAAMEAKEAQAQKSLAALQAGPDPAVLRQQVQELQASLNSQTPPTRRNTLAVSTALTDYAAENGLRLVASSTADDQAPGAGAGGTVPVLKVFLEAEGPLATLVGLFGAVEGFPAARVQLLQFDPESDGVWFAKLELTVPYGSGG